MPSKLRLFDSLSQFDWKLLTKDVDYPKGPRVMSHKVKSARNEVGTHTSIHNLVMWLSSEYCINTSTPLYIVTNYTYVLTLHAFSCISLSCHLEMGTEFIWVNFGAIMEFHSRGPIQLGACVHTV